MAQEHTQAKLGRIPMILEILVIRGQLPKEEHLEIVRIIGEIAKNKKAGLPIPEEYQKYEGMYAGGMVVARCEERDGEAARVVAKRQVDDGLRYQSQLIAQAAVEDIQAIAAGTTVTFPPYIAQPHWGNGGVNNISNPITIDNSAASAANIAKLIVVLVKNNPEAAKAAQAGVVAAKMLTDFILEGDTPKHPAKMVGEWIAAATQTLESVATAAGVEKGIVELYTKNRITTEVRGGVDLALAKSKEQAASAARE